MMGDLKRLKETAITVVDSSPASLLASMKEALSDALGYDVDNADPWLVVAASLLPYFVQARALADVSAKASNLAFATGDTLDALGAGHGMVRYGARNALVYTYVSMNGQEITASNEGNLNIQSLVLVKRGSAGNVIARFVYGSGRVPFKAGDRWLPIVLTCTETGPQNNGLTEFEIEDVLWEYVMNDPNAVAPGVPTVAKVYDPNNNLELITSSGGAEAETDDEFAQRIHNEVAASNAAGSLAYYKAAALRVPGIIDVRVLTRAEINQALKDLYGELYQPNKSFDNYDVFVLPLAEEYARGWETFVDVPMQISINSALVTALQSALDDVKIVGSNIFVMPAQGLLQMFSWVYTIKYYLYKSDVNENGLDEMQARIQTAFIKYKHWQFDSLEVPYSIEQLIKFLIDAGAAKMEFFDINGKATGGPDEMYRPMYTTLYAARRFGRLDPATKQNVILDSLVLTYGGVVEKVKGYV